MAYGAKYIMQAYDRRGALIESTILQNGYSGSSQLIDGGMPPVKITWDTNEDKKHDSIKASSCTLTLNCNASMFFYDLYTSDPSKYMMVVKINSVVTWLGYLLPDQYTEPYAAAEAGYFVDIVATDRLASLKDTDYINGATKYTGRVLLLDIIRTILDKIAIWNYNASYGGYVIGLALLETNNTDSNATNALVQDFENNDKYVNDDGTVWKCYDVLDNILKQFGCRLMQYAGVWQILRIDELTTPIQVQTYDYTGAYISNQLNDLQLAITPNSADDSSRLIWMGDANMIMLPPWKGFNLIQKLLPKADFTGDGNFAKWIAGDHSVWNASGVQTFSSRYLDKDNGTLLICANQPIGAWQGYMHASFYIDGTSDENLTVEFTFSGDGGTTTFQFQVILYAASTWFLDSTGTWTTTPTFIQYTVAPTDGFVTKFLESDNIPAGASHTVLIEVFNTQSGGGATSWFKNIAVNLYNDITHAPLPQDDITTAVVINSAYNLQGDDISIAGGDTPNVDNGNVEYNGILAWAVNTTDNKGTYNWGIRGGSKTSRLLNIIKQDFIDLYKLPSKKLSGKLESSIYTPLNIVREPWADNALFMMHRFDWSPVDNEIDVELVELFTTSYFLLEDGSGYIMMEDGVSHYNY